MRNQIRTRTCARKLARVRTKSNLKRACDVRAALFEVCDVRSHICMFSHTFVHFLCYFQNFSGLFKVVSLFIHIYLPSKRLVCFKFKLPKKNCKVRVRVWLNFGKFAICVRPKKKCAGVRACGPKIRRNSVWKYVDRQGFLVHNLTDGLHCIGT